MIPAPLTEPFSQYEGAADEVHALRLQHLASEMEVLLLKDELALVESTIQLTVEGKNAEERKANLTIATQNDPKYQVAIAQLRAHQTLTSKLAADLERAIDRKRSYGWLVRAVGGINSPSSDDA